MFSLEKLTEGEVLLINKPLRWTSFDVVNKLRSMLTHATGKKLKVGHAGTLDPLATGLLIICTGKKTTTIDEIQSAEKEYTGALTLGATTPSFDLETEPDASFPTAHITTEQIHGAAKEFTGTLQQTPPVYSAVKIDGNAAYKYARKGKIAELKPREITISEFEITKIEMTTVSFRIVCSKGTYIRSLADDFGKRLGSGAYLSSLCRIRIGEFQLKNALTMEQFASEIGAEFSSGKREGSVKKKNFH